MTSGGHARDEVMRHLIKCNSMLSGYLYALAEDWAIVEEAIQETAVYVCNHWADFTPGTNFAAWARTVARLRCLEIIGREKRQHRIAGAMAPAVGEGAWDEGGERSADRKRALTECLQKLPRQYTPLLAMKYRQGLDGPAIAGALNKSIEAVYMTLSRVRRLLKECIEKRLGETA